MKIYLSAFADEAAKNFKEQLEALNDNNIGLIELHQNLQFSFPADRKKL